MVVTQDPLKTDLAAERIQFLKESQWWSRERLDAYQLAELKSLLRYCRDHIPYYQRTFRESGVDVDQFHHLTDLKKIPLLTKQDIQGRYQEFIPSGRSLEEFAHRSTGGSTGTTLTVYSDLDFFSRDKANTVYYMDIAGYDPFHFRSLRIYGDKIPEEIIQRGDYWYEKDNKLIVSCYHYAQSTFPRYLQKINAYQPDYIHSRPSAILPLAEYLANHKREIQFTIGAVFLDGEFLSEAQRNFIEQTFGCRVYNTYGHTEGGAVGVSCQSSRLMHFMPQVGVLELLDKDGLEIFEEGKRGEITVTGFNNKVFPLIRYRTFDVGVYTNQECPCGRKFKMLKEIEGRIQDFVVNRKGNLVPLSPAVFNYNDMDWKGIRQFQVQQKKEGVLILKIVREENIPETESQMRARVLGEFNKIFNYSFELDLEYLEEIPRTRIGKFRYLDQQLDLSGFDFTE